MVNYPLHKGLLLRVKRTWDVNVVPIGTIGEVTETSGGAVRMKFSDKKIIRQYGPTPWFAPSSVVKYLEVAEGPW